MFDLLTLEDVENKTGAMLLLDANYYVDGRTTRSGCGRARCQLAEMPAAGVRVGRRMITAYYQHKAAKRPPPPTAMTAMAIRWETTTAKEERFIVALNAVKGSA